MKNSEITKILNNQIEKSNKQLKLRKDRGHYFIAKKNGEDSLEAKSIDYWTRLRNTSLKLLVQFQA